MASKAVKRAKPQRQSQHIVNEYLRIAVQKTIDEFIADGEATKLEFPPSLTREQRAYIHEYVKDKNLKSKSFGTDSRRYLMLFKADKSTIIKDDATFTLDVETKRRICLLLKNSPLSQKEKCDLQPTESKSLGSNILQFRITIGSLTSGKVSIPPVNQNPELIGVRRSLPIFAYRSQILSLIASNQVIVLSGQTGSGKTTQVPQYLLEEAAQTKKNCRIICTQPRRLSAISVAERVCQERNEQVGQTIGYQIRLESRISSNSNLIYCTNGVLLRCLMSGNAEELFGQITHIIVDEVHERDKFSDFLLISIKENLHLNPNTKIILMSATIDANVFTKYFNDAPHIEIPGRLYDVEILPLEHVLLEIGYTNAKVEEAKKRLQLLEAKQSREKEKEVIETLPKTTVHLDVETRELLDETFKSWWLSNDDDDEAFNQFTYMVGSENVPIDYRHSDTDMTALMIVAGKGYRQEIQILLKMGADPFVKCRGDYTAMDLAGKMGHVECAAYLTSIMEMRRENKSIAVEASSVPSQYDPKMAEIVLNAYQTTTNEDEIDHDLLFDVIKYIHQNFQMGSILVFLPGYDDIIEANDRLTKFLRDPTGFAHKIFMLHSNMQITDQKSVFQSHGAFCRKIILSTNIAETSVTIDDVVYVIDTGKVKQKSFDSLTGTSLLQATWISKACGKQRTGRAGRTRPGVCLRLYSTQRHEHMDDFTVPEILRVPLTEICLQTKLIARQTTIGEFLAKAIQAPAPLSVRQSISLLQAIGALDEQENLTALGVHLADLPVDVRLGKTLIYSVLLKCLDPVLTIVAALSVNDPFTLPAIGHDKERMVAIKKSLAENSMSDHLTLLRIFQKWNDSKNANRDRQFCADNFVSSGTMATICGLRSQILGHLRSVELVKSRGAGNIHELNTNSDSWAVVKACIAAGLYPNICRIDRSTASLKSRLDTKIVPHSSSIFRDRDIKKSKAMLKTIPSDWIFYEEKSRFGRLNLIKCNTVVTPVTVALFAGPIMQTEEENLTPMRDMDSDSENDQCLPDVPAYTEIKYKVDDWIYFCLDTETAFLTFHLRQKLNALLVKILHNPSQYFQSEKDSVVIKTLTQLLNDEERRYKLPLPVNIGTRPKTVMLGFAADLHYGAQETNEESQNIDQLMRQSVNQHPPRPWNDGSSSRNDGQRIAHAHGPNVDPKFDASRYFLVKANIRKDVNVTINGGRWQLSNTVYDYLYKLVKNAPSRHYVIFFHIVTANEIFGAARISLVNSNLVVHKLSEKVMHTRQVRSHFDSLAHKPRYLDLYYDGEELPKDVAAVMKSLFL